VERYQAVYELLPPIRVKRETFRLIGGLHRLAAGRDRSDFIRILEEDIPDDGLYEAAVADNAAHGLPFTAAERKAIARRLYERHHPDTGGETGEAWLVTDIADRAGVHRSTIHNWLAKERHEGEAAAKEGAESVEIRHISSAPVERTSASGRTYTVGSQRNAQPKPPKSAPAPNGFERLKTAVAALPPEPEYATAAALERSGAAIERLAAAVETADERIATLLDDLAPEHAGEVYQLAERMVAAWGRVADRALRLQAEAESEVPA
jgi:hypothetical protein